MTPCFYQSNTDRIKEIDPEELTITLLPDRRCDSHTAPAHSRIDSGRKLLAEESPDGSDHAGKLDRNGGRVKNVRCVKRTLC